MILIFGSKKFYNPTGLYHIYFHHRMGIFRCSRRGYLITGFSYWNYYCYYLTDFTVVFSHVVSGPDGDEVSGAFPMPHIHCDSVFAELRFRVEVLVFCCVPIALCIYEQIGN